MATLQQVVEYNRNHVDWVSFFSLVDTLGKSMNSQKDRFEKSQIFESSLQAFSEGKIIHTDFDGVDHHLRDLYNEFGIMTTQEMKFINGVFYKEYKRGVKIRAKGKPVDIKLMNSMGNNKHKDLPDSYAEYLLVVDNYSVHAIKVSSLKPYIVISGDGIYAKKVPYSLFTLVIGPSDVSNRQARDIDYKEHKTKLHNYLFSKFL